jgi:hypothetical protein
MKRYLLIAAPCLCLSAVWGVLSADVPEVKAYSEYMTGVGRLADEIPAYPDAPFYPLGQGLSVNRMAREMGYAVTPDAVPTVADRFEAVWTSQGFRVSRGMHREVDEQWVIATSPQDPVIRTVVVSAQEDGKTAIIASVRDKLALQRDVLIPKPAECDVIEESGAQDGPIKTETALLQCDAPLVRVLGFYDEALAASKRRAVVEPTLSRPEAELSYSSDVRQVTLLLRQTLAEQPKTAVSITWQERTPQRGAP